MIHVMLIIAYFCKFEGEKIILECHVLVEFQAVFLMITDQLKGLENTKSNLSKKCFYLLEVSGRNE